MKNLLMMAFAITLVLAACNRTPADKKAETSVAAPAPTPAAAAQATPAATDTSHTKSWGMASIDGTTCYAIFDKKDVTAVQLIIKGDKVTGYMDWAPFEKDGGHGILTGTRSGNDITADFLYFIEGSKNTEEVLFKIDGKTLLQAQSELVEKKGKLVIKDKAKAKFSKSFATVDCDKVAKNIAVAKSMEKNLKKM
jgi:hypothetical protein